MLIQTVLKTSKNIFLLTFLRNCLQRIWHGVRWKNGGCPKNTECTVNPNEVKKTQTGRNIGQENLGKPEFQVEVQSQKK